MIITSSHSNFSKSDFPAIRLGPIIHCDDVDCEKRCVDEKINELNDLIEKKPTNEDECYFERGKIHFHHLNLFSEAIKDFTKCIDLNPEFFDAYYLRGQSYYRIREYLSCLPDLEIFVKHYKKIKCDCKFETKHEEVVEMSRRSVLQMAIYKIGSSLYLLERYPEALSIFKDLMKFGLVRCNCGGSDCESNKKSKFQHAIKCFTKEIRKMESKNNKQSKDYYNLFAFRGELHRVNKDFKASAKDLSIAIYNLPSDRKLHNLRYECYHHLGNDKLALKDINKSLSIEPSQSYLYHPRGMIFFKHRHYQNALDDFTKNIELWDPEKGDHNIQNNELYYSYLYRSKTYSLLNNHERAMEDVNKCIEQLDPENLEGYAVRSEEYRRCSMFKEAIDDRNKILQKDPDVELEAMTLMNGDSYLSLGRYSEAIECYSKVLVDPSVKEKISNAVECYERFSILVSTMNRGRCFFLLEKYKEAISDFLIVKEFVEIKSPIRDHCDNHSSLICNPNNVRCWLGDCYYRVKRYDLAIIELSQSIDNSKSFSTIVRRCRYLRSLASRMMRDFEKSNEDLTALIENLEMLLKSSGSGTKTSITSSSSSSSSEDDIEQIVVQKKLYLFLRSQNYIRLSDFGCAYLDIVESRFDDDRNELDRLRRNMEVDEWKGKIFFVLKMWKRSVREFSKAILSLYNIQKLKGGSKIRKNWNKDCSRLFFFRGIVFQKMKGYKKSEDDFSKSIELFPEEPKYFFNRYILRKYYFLEGSEDNMFEKDKKKVQELDPSLLEKLESWELMKEETELIDQKKKKKMKKKIWGGFTIELFPGEECVEIKRCCDCKNREKRRLKKCGACRFVFYCSTKCQKNHWKFHKKICRNLQL